MSSSTDAVARFLARWAVPGDLDQAFRDYFVPTTVWENVGLAVTNGIEEAVAFNRQLGLTMRMATIRVEMLAIAEAGNKVLTERVDHIYDGAGILLMSVRCMGVFEMAQGKILAWRDFFEPIPQLSAKPA
jgi:limonene-1,2-epoxide hydrolase